MSLTNERFQIRSYPSPFATDVLFYELRDSVLPKNKQPAYGDPHPNPVLWPNHILVLIEPNPRSGDGKQVWWYAANRENQDEYNFQFTHADIGGTKFDAVSREYVILRSDFDPDAYAMGDTMANVPASLFDGSYVLAERSEVYHPSKEISSMFVLERHLYIKRVPLIDIEINRETGEAKAVTTNYYYRGEVIVDTFTIEALVADEDNAYWDLDEDGYGRVAKQLSENWFEVTERQWIDLGDVWEWTLDNRGPERYYCPQSFKKTVVTTSGNPEGPIDEEDLPVVPAGQMVSIFKWGEIMRVTTVTMEGDLQVLSGANMMPDDGKVYLQTNELVSKNDVSEGGIDEFGKVVEYTDIDGCRSAAVTRQAVSLEDEKVLAQDGTYPEKFVKNQKIREVVVTETGASIGDPELPNFEDGIRVEIQQKGHIRKTKTITQEGDLTPLPGLTVDESDGIIYPSTDEVVPLSEVPTSPSEISNTGVGIIFEPIDSDLALKRTRQIISVEPKDRKVADKLAPDKFFPSGGLVSVTVATAPASPDIPDAAAAELYERVTIDQKGSLRTTETVTQEADPEPLLGTTFDPRTGEGFIETQELVPHASVTPTDVTVDGEVDTYQPVNPHFAIKTTRKVASTSQRTWQDIINYEWPPVLIGIEYETYTKRSGGLMVVPHVTYKEGFNGPQIATATQYWQKSPITPVSPQQMIPRGFFFQCPYFSINAPPCLHSDVTFIVNTGTVDPIWEPASYTRTFPATNFVDWPEQIEWVESKPYNGGYIVTKWVINSPS